MLRVFLISRKIVPVSKVIEDYNIIIILKMIYLSSSPRVTLKMVGNQMLQYPYVYQVLLLSTNEEF